LSWFFGAPDRTDPTAGRDRPAPWNPRSGFEGEGAIQGDVSRPKQSGGRVTATEKKLIARLPPVSDEGGDRRQAGHLGAGERSVRRVSRSRSRLRNSPLPGRPNEARSLRERAKNRKPEGQGSQREAAVCRRPGALNKSG
jgi:hypothetical protein